MSTEPVIGVLIKSVNETSVIDLGTSDQVIAGYRGRLIDLQADTAAGYSAVTSGIKELKTLKRGVEKSRKELKQNSLDYGRLVDTEGNRVKKLIDEILNTLEQRKLAVDEEIANFQRAAEESRLAAVEAKAKAERDKIDAEDKAERERHAAELKADKEALAKERAESEKLRDHLEEEAKKLKDAQDALRDEQTRVAKEAAKVERDKQDEIDRASAAKQAVIDEAVRKMQDARLALKRKEEAEKAKIEAARRAEKHKPDIEKLCAYTQEIEEIKQPEVESEWAREILRSASTRLLQLSSDILNEVQEASK